MTWLEGFFFLNVVGVGFVGSFFTPFARGGEGRLFLGFSKEGLQRAWCPLHLPPGILFSWASGKGNLKVSQIPLRELVARGAGGEGGGFLKDWKAMFLYLERKVFLVTFPFFPLCVEITHCHFTKSYNILYEEDRAVKNPTTPR